MKWMPYLLLACFSPVIIAAQTVLKYKQNKAFDLALHNIIHDAKLDSNFFVGEKA